MHNFLVRSKKRSIFTNLSEVLTGANKPAADPVLLLDHVQSKRICSTSHFCEHYWPLPRQRWGQMLVSWRFSKYQILAPMSGHYGSLCGSLLATSGPLEVPVRAYGTSMMSLLPPKASGERSWPFQESFVLVKEISFFDTSFWRSRNLFFHM